MIRRLLRIALPTVFAGFVSVWFAAGTPAVAIQPQVSQSAIYPRQLALAERFTFHDFSGEILKNAAAGAAAGAVVALLGEPAIVVAAGVGAIGGAVAGGVTYAWDWAFGVQAVSLAQHYPVKALD